METIILNSCSKINIGLNVLRKRSDGFHDIETIFYPVKLCDTISFKKSDEFRFFSNNSTLVDDSNNLIIRAKNKIEELTEEKVKAEITLAKYIPLGSGLGGGSSNAACTLKGLNMLYDLNLSEPRLKKISLELGSDVPFFLKSSPCYGTGRGEDLEEIKLKINQPILIINPRIHISTKWAFENVTPVIRDVPIKEIIKKDITAEDFRQYFTNDFEDVVSKVYPEIGLIKTLMYSSGALFSSMSGSGSTVYGIFSTLEKAREVQKYFKDYLSFIHYEDL